MGRRDKAARNPVSHEDATRPHSPNGREGLRKAFEGFGLGQYEARALLAVVELGSATAAQIAQFAELPRPSVYAAMEALVAKGVALSSPGKFTAWSSPGRDEVVGRLEASYLKQLAELEAGVKTQAEQARRLLAQLGPEAPLSPTPYMQVLRRPGAGIDAYDRLVAATTRELLVFNQPPYDGEINLDPAVLDALSRKVRARAIYEEGEINDPGAAAIRAVWEKYHAAGVEGRVADEVPIRLAVFDRRAVLFSLTNPDRLGPDRDQHVLVEHPGFAAFAADAFENRWEASVPYPDHRREAHYPKRTTNA